MTFYVPERGLKSDFHTLCTSASSLDGISQQHAVDILGLVILC